MKSKPHYLLLDALRGVAALVVLFFHLYEGYGYEVAEGTGIYSQVCDHGYLAVDFFFILSGFVISYAYDDRWKTDNHITVFQFFKRRLIRLHPIVIISVIIGVLAFGIQGFTQWDFEGSNNLVQVSISMVMVAMLLNMFMLPNIPGMPFEVRGNGELFPLNGPHWSLFFEYIGNIIYALFLCRINTKKLSFITVICGVLLSIMVINDGYLGVGWTLPDFWSGLLRMLFPYCLGMLTARIYRKRRSDDVNKHRALYKYSFLICAVLLVVFLAVPFVGDPYQPWQNGLYIMFMLIVLFPSILWLAAKGSEVLNKDNGLQHKIYTYLGEISYPLYAVHYPVIYLFFWYIGFPNVDKSMSEVWPIAVGAFVISILLATAVLYLYDKPVRRWLSKRYLK